MGIDDVAEILARTSGIDEYVVTVHHCHVASFGQHARRQQRDRTITATVFRDGRSGRGQASFAIAGRASRADIERIAKQAAISAGLGLGPPWQMPPASAPARVIVLDPDLSDPREAAAAITAEATAIARAAKARILASRIEVERTRTEVRTSARLAAAYEASRHTLELAIAGSGGGIHRGIQKARRARDLAIEPTITAWTKRAADAASAAPLAPGTVDMVLTASALATSARPSAGSGRAAAYARYGWLATIAAHADAALSRRGTTRLGRGRSAYGEHDAAGDPLTIYSDGTLHFASQSSPFGSLGEPVRRFAVTRDGIMANLALDLREAALRGEAPNGGVRNLIIAPGTLDAAEILAPQERPVLEVADPSWLEINPRTGAAAVGLGLATLHRPGSSTPVPVLAGTWSGDALALFARARLARETVRDGWYRGPIAARIPNVAIR